MNNPIIKGWYEDHEARVYDGKVYNTNILRYGRHLHRLGNRQNE